MTHPHPSKTLINPRIQVLGLLQDHQRPLIHPITAIDFSSPTHRIALSSSASLSIYSSPSLLPYLHPLLLLHRHRLLPLFPLRQPLMGSHSGTLHIFNPASRQPLSLLRSHSHSRPARLFHFPHLSDKLHLFSSADKALLNNWDVPSENPILSFQVHKDYVHAGAASPATPHQS